MGVSTFERMPRIVGRAGKPVSTVKFAWRASASVQSPKASASPKERIGAWISTKTPRIVGLVIWLALRERVAWREYAHAQAESSRVVEIVSMRCVILPIVAAVEKPVRFAVRSVWMASVLAHLIKASVSWMERMLVWICIKIPVDAVDAHQQRRHVLHNKPVSKGLVLPRRSLLKCGDGWG